MTVDLEKVIRSWAAGREGVSQLDISNVKFDFDEGWPGTDVTSGEMPEVVINYTVCKDVIYKREVAELGDFITELAAAMANRPAISEPIEEKPPTTDELEIDIPGRGLTKCHALFISDLRNMYPGDSMPFDIRIDGEPLNVHNVAYVIVSPA